MQTTYVYIVKMENLQQTLEQILYVVIVLLVKNKKVILHVRYVPVVNTVRKNSTIDVLIVMQVNLVNLFIGHLVSFQNNILLEMLVVMLHKDLTLVR